MKIDPKKEKSSLLCLKNFQCQKYISFRIQFQSLPFVPLFQDPIAGIFSDIQSNIFGKLLFGSVAFYCKPFWTVEKLHLN